MDVAAVLTAGKSVLELGQKLAQLITKAQKNPDATRRVLLYLESARGAVQGLGVERQHILTDVGRCNVGNADQLNAVWTRLDVYLHQDSLRPQLESSIQGLRACRQTIEREANSAWWRKNDKQAAVETFSRTLFDLESTLQQLSNKYYPTTSGMGIQTLVPIFDLLTRVRKDQQFGHFNRGSVESVHEELGELVAQALRDKDHEEWFRMAGKVEASVAELRLAFSVNVIDAAKDDF